MLWSLQGTTIKIKTTEVCCRCNPAKALANISNMGG